DRRGLRAGGAGQRAVATLRHVHLRRAQRDPSQPRRVRTVARLRRGRRAGDGDRVLVPGHRPDALQRGHLGRLPAAAGDLPGHLAVGPGGVPDRRHRLLPGRPPDADADGVLMSALATPADPIPDAGIPAAVITNRRAALRRVPGKAKVGAAILGLFILVAIVGPWIAPFDPSATTPGQALPIGPTATHLLGTTATGQDVLSQLLVGTRSTVVLGLLTGVIATTLAVLIGTSAGFLGGLSDEGLSLVANVFLVLPALPLLVVIL